MALDLASAVATHLDANVFSTPSGNMLFHVFPLATSSLKSAPRRISAKWAHPLRNSRLRDHASPHQCGCLPEVRSFIVSAHWVK